MLATAMAEAEGNEGFELGPGGKPFAVLSPCCPIGLKTYGDIKSNWSIDNGIDKHTYNAQIKKKLGRHPPPEGQTFQEYPTKNLLGLF